MHVHSLDITYFYFILLLFPFIESCFCIHFCLTCWSNLYRIFKTWNATNCKCKFHSNFICLFLQYIILFYNFSNSWTISSTLLRNSPKIFGNISTDLILNKLTSNWSYFKSTIKIHPRMLNWSSWTVRPFEETHNELTNLSILSLRPHPETFHSSIRILDTDFKISIPATATNKRNDGR